MRKSPLILTSLLATMLAAAPFSVHQGNHVVGVVTAHASDIKVVVNDEVVTSYDIARRVAFLKLQRRKGSLNQIAVSELTDEALKRDALRSAGYRIPDSNVDAAFANFARGNKLSTAQMSSILNQAGVTTAHFKEYIRVQIGWGQLVQARAGGGGQLMNEQDVVAKMLENGGQKPTSTEYTLQQVIFVVPQAKRSSQLATRRKEANNMRAKVNNCDATKQLAMNVRDVTVRDLGRILELRLPPLWEKEVIGLKAGATTRTKDTDRGVEFLIVCDARSVSDDRVAQLEFSTQQLESGGGDIGKDYLEELRKNAKIQNR